MSAGVGRAGSLFLRSRLGLRNLPRALALYFAAFHVYFGATPYAFYELGAWRAMAGGWASAPAWRAVGDNTCAVGYGLA